MVDINQERLNRLYLLEKIYDESGGDENCPVGTQHIARELGWDFNDLDRAMQYLKGDGLISYKNFLDNAKITHLGIKEIENARTNPDKPTEHFPPFNLIYVEGNVTNSQLQQATSHSQQTLTVEALLKDSILQTLSEIKASVNELGLKDQIENDLIGEIETIEAQSKVSKSKKGVITASLEAIRSILKGTVEKAGAATLAAQLPHWISQISDHLKHLGH
ncbi:multi- copper enzyme maturation abc-type transport system permease component-like protein [Leptolyngbya sp. Heron Island J]|uniref:hypothetical protein n=1 Tax=Leptolyngbya sp. Heron Island J TaxID=1385935 RepID=UPI0003B9F4ED|nr:hypothetical protein [Leptolyngbya sp. Heron Island J]ESA34036.1 multi- copper enzyme maturation abc-type transport system permease component-like protein [Leptolyngbya sp. Heron Island J]